MRLAAPRQCPSQLAMATGEGVAELGRSRRARRRLLGGAQFHCTADSKVRLAVRRRLLAAATRPALHAKRTAEL